MDERRSYRFALSLAAVLAAGFCFAWTPRYWGIAVALAGVALLTMAWVAFEERVVFFRAMIPVAVLACWGLVQIALSQTISSWWTTRSLLIWVSSAISFFLASQVLQSSRNREIFFSVLLWSCTALALLSIVQTYGDPNHVFWIFPAQPGSVGTFLYKNQFAAMLELAAPIALYRAVSSQRTRYTGAGAFTVIFAAGVASVSRSGFALLICELLFAILYAVYTKHMSLKQGAGVIVVAALLLAVGAFVGGPENLWNHFQDNVVEDVRNDLRPTTQHMATERPYFGFGLGTYSLAYPAYAQFDTGAFINAAHGDWGEWAVEGGFAFAACIAVLLLLVGGAAMRSLWGVGVLAVAVHSVVDYPAREPSIALFWFAVIGALAAWSAKSKRAVAPHGEKS